MSRTKQELLKQLGFGENSPEALVIELQALRTVVYTLAHSLCNEYKVSLLEQIEKDAEIKLLAQLWDAIQAKG